MGCALKDSLAAPIGIFTLRAFRRGRFLWEWEERNLIVNLSKGIHANLLGGNVTGNSITQIGFGTNLTAPVAGNTTLTSAYVKAIDNVSYPASNQVAFTFSLASSEDNGMAIGEFGLLTASNALYARKTRTAALNKDTDLSLNGTWVISF